MASLTPSPKMQFFDANGNPLVGGKLYTYSAGTTSPLATYTDSTGGSANTNPIILDSRGEANVWLDVGSYKMVLKDSVDALIWTVDNILGAPSSNAALVALAASDGSSLVGFIQSGTGAVATTVQAKLRDIVSVTDFMTSAQIADAKSSSPILDLSSAIQAAITAVQTAASTKPNPAPEVWFPGDWTYCIASQITVNSDYNTMLRGVNGKPTLKWIGTTMSTSTQDNSTGAMVYFSGTDHAFGGIENFYIDGQSKANFAVFWAGSWNSDFKVKDLHYRYLQLDGLRHINSGGSGPVSGEIINCTGFPATGAVFSGVNAVVGRYPINLTLNTSTGQVTIRGGGMDSGASGCIGINSVGSAGCDIRLDSLRFEMYKPNCDAIVLDYSTAPTIGTLTIENCKSAAAAGTTSTGTIRALVRNATSAGTRPVLRIRPLMANDAMTDIYTHVADTTKSVTYDNKRLWGDLLINTTATTGSLPVSAALSTTTMQGDISYDTANEQILIGSPTGGTGLTTRRIRAGRSVIVGPAATPVTGADVDTAKLYHNNNLASFTYNLPSIATIGTGWLTPVFCTVGAGVITLAPNGTDAIDTKAASASYASSAAAGNSVQLMSGPGSRWLVVAYKGTWA